ncbi:MAG: hypothetical protein M3Q36_02495 [bacterium]|nr:hypothetical protein [bacterium]
MSETLQLTEELLSTQDNVLAEAFRIIDGALGIMMSRELVSSGEVTDLLLDVRNSLTTPTP